MSVRFLVRSLVALLVLYGLVFVFGDVLFARVGAPRWVVVSFPVGLIAFQYLLAPVLIEWLLPIGWVDLDDPEQRRLWGVSDASAAFVLALCADRGLRAPRFGLIQSGTPNAFSFGRVRADARVVVSTGLIEILTTDELNAVLAHEIGHVEHWDFAVMTMAALAPMLLYQAYFILRGNKNGRAIAYGAYLAYMASQFVVLLLNRTREYFADQCSACVTHRPAALQSALVKIACGLVKSEGKYAQAMVDADVDRASARREHRLAGTVAVMGIASMHASEALALAGVEPSAAARVMRWDLVNPWARVYELRSTHPLTARRVRALSDAARSMGQTPAYEVSGTAPARWGLFPLEVLLWASPFAALLILLGIHETARVPRLLGMALPAGTPSMLLLFIGVTWMLRTLYRYHGTFEPQTIDRLIADLDASEMRSRAVRLEGEIIGRGVPGAFWSPDLVLRESTGLLFVLYRQSIPFARLLFAITSADALTGTHVTLDGWFRRGLRPYVELATLTTDDGVTHRAYSRWVQLALAAVVVLVGWYGLLG